MFIDTHGHLNIMLKNDFDTRLTTQEVANASYILQEAYDQGVQSIINVATSLVESNNSVMLAHAYKNIFATVGIHPNDCTASWYSDFNTIRSLARNKHEHKIVGIGECGIDRHYPNDPNYNLERQKDAFRAHIELALEYDLALVVHSRDAYDETLRILDEYTHDIKRGVMHCFSYDQAFAEHVTKNNFVLGIGGTITYPKNTELRTIVATLKPNHFVLETDAPFLPPQQWRGQQNHPKYIPIIATAIAELRGETCAYIGQQTTNNAILLFALESYVKPE